MTEAGLVTREDAAGNLYGRLEGSDPGLPALLTGSHFDTTLDAGRYDGVLGVLGAIEAVERLQTRPRRSIEVIGFAGEEPRFGAGCIGQPGDDRRAVPRGPRSHGRPRRGERRCRDALGRARP